MKTINLSPLGKPVSDFHVSNWVDSMLTKRKFKFEISNQMIIDEIRARIKEGKINITDIRVTVEGEHFPIDLNGRSAIWFPIQEIQEKILIRIL